MPPMVYGRGGDKQRGKGVYRGRSEEIQTRSADLSGFWSPDLRLVPVPASLTSYLVPCTTIPSTIASDVKLHRPDFLIVAHSSLSILPLINAAIFPETEIISRLNRLNRNLFAVYRSNQRALSHPTKQTNLPLRTLRWRISGSTMSSPLKRFYCSICAVSPGFPKRILVISPWSEKKKRRTASCADQRRTDQVTLRV